ANVYLVPNKYNLNRYVYGLILPFINFILIKECNIIRAFHLIGTLPAIFSKVFFKKPFVYNYAFNYKRVALIDKLYMQFVIITLLTPFTNLLADQIICATPAVLKYLPKKRVTILPNGVDCQVFKPL